MKKTGRKFKCIGLEENEIIYWKNQFTIGKIYDEVKDKNGNIKLIGNISKSIWFVEDDQFELVEDE
jgi:hypothetical protein